MHYVKEPKRRRKRKYDQRGKDAHEKKP